MGMGEAGMGEAGMGGARLTRLTHGSSSDHVKRDETAARRAGTAMAERPNALSASASSLSATSPKER